MSFVKIAILAVIQGITELLPVSSSAHVIIAEKFMGMDPTAPEMTLFLVMLHTGTMFAVIVYFWKTWKNTFFKSWELFKLFIINIFFATMLTGFVGLTLQMFIEKILLRHVKHAAVEMIFGNTVFISIALMAAGLLIIYSDLKDKKTPEKMDLNVKKSIWIGAVQGICLPFRGFSRSGSTISTGLILKIDKMTAESFSFALAVVLTPPVIIREVLRLSKTAPASHFANAVYPSLIGVLLSFVAGLFALRFLSRWLERGRWNIFGYYCVVISLVLLVLAHYGF